MNDLFKVIDNLLKESNKNNKTAFDDTNIRKCLELLDSGWSISAYNKIPKTSLLDVVFKNDAGQEYTIRLNFSEQKAWLLVLRKKKELEKNVKSI